MDQSKKWFYTVARYSDTVILIVLGSTLVFIFNKLKFKIDVTAIITLSIFLMLALIRVINDYQ